MFDIIHHPQRQDENYLRWSSYNRGLPLNLQWDEHAKSPTSLWIKMQKGKKKNSDLRLGDVREKS